MQAKKADIDLAKWVRAMLGKAVHSDEEEEEDVEYEEGVRVGYTLPPKPKRV